MIPFYTPPLIKQYSQNMPDRYDQLVNGLAFKRHSILPLLFTLSLLSGCQNDHSSQEFSESSVLTDPTTQTELLPADSQVVQKQLVQKQADSTNDPAWFNLVQKRIQNGQYQVRPSTDSNVLQSYNPSLKLAASFKENGTTVSYESINHNNGVKQSGSLTLATSRLRLDEQEIELQNKIFSAQECVRSGFSDEYGQCIKKAQRMLAPTLEEWWINQPLSLEWGWTIPASAQGTQTIRVALSLKGAQSIELEHESRVLVEAEQGAFYLDHLLAVDQQQHTLPSKFFIQDQKLWIEVDSRQATFPVMIDPAVLPISQAWTDSSDQANSNFAIAVAGAGDVNGDGFMDALIGADLYDESEALNVGKAFLYLGSPDGLRDTVAWSYTTGQTNSNFAYALAGLGDVNGDQLSDIAIGAYRHDSATVSNAGQVLVFYGNANGLADQPSWFYEGTVRNGYLGKTVSEAGDVNGDGYQDLLVGAPGYGETESSEGQVLAFYGSASGLANTPSWQFEPNSAGMGLGNSLAGGRDINGDGFDDIAVGSPVHETNKGYVAIFLGSDTGLANTSAWSVTGATAEDQLGYALAMADASGDEKAELYIGAPGKNALYELNGTDDLSESTAQQVTTGPNFFGSAISRIGDMNQDRFEDIAVASVRQDISSAGQVRFFYGSPEGIYPSYVARKDGLGSDDLFGRSIAGLGDTNGDGYDDLLIGAPDFGFGQVSTGFAYVYLGVETGLRPSPARIINGDQASAYLGYAMDIVGDINGDGYDDIALGAYRYDGGQNDEGAVFVYLGSSNGLSEIPTRVWESNVASRRLGYSISAAGDVNGDGYDDVVVGGYNRYAYLYLGSNNLSTSASYIWDTTTSSSTSNYVTLCKSLGDINGDGYDDIALGKTSSSTSYHVGIYLGAESFDTNKDHQVYAYYEVTGIGDINGDGYDDVAYTPYSSQTRIDILHGSANFNTTVDQNLTGPSNFGISIVGGDFNGDGFSDLTCTTNNYASIRMYPGSATGLSALAWSYTGASNMYRLYNAQDVNGDGFDDLLIDRTNAQLFLGGENGFKHEPDWVLNDTFYRGAGGGDLNGDGLSDVLLSNYSNDSSKGQVQVFYGSQGVPEGGNNHFVLANAGDLNGDGFDEIAVGDPSYTDELFRQGRVLIFPGSQAGLGDSAIWAQVGSERDENFGGQLSTAGDINDDGYADLLISSPRADGVKADVGRVNLYLGQQQGLAEIPAWSYTGTYSRGRLGSETAAIGDINDDGYDDIAIATPYYANGQSREGLVEVFFGAPLGLSNVPDWQYEPNRAGSLFGLEMTGAGDLNGDGFDDLAVAAPHDNGRSGRVFIFMSQGNNLNSVALREYVGNQYGNLFGASLWGGSDVNGDGLDDLLIGEPGFTIQGQGAGQINWVPGNFAGPPATASVITQGVGEERLGTQIVAGDVNGDSYADVYASGPLYSPNNDLAKAGRVVRFLGSENGPTIPSNWNSAGNAYKLSLGTYLAIGQFGSDQRKDLAAVGYASYIYLWYGANTISEEAHQHTMGVQNAPVALAQAVITEVNTALDITLRGIDADGDELTYVITEQPSKGNLSGSLPNLTYTPTQDAVGQDRFSYTVSDASQTSAPATVTIKLNRKPSAIPQDLTTTVGTALQVNLSGNDEDNDALSYLIKVEPSHGILNGSGASKTYIPNPGYTGPDSFSFSVSDGHLESLPAQISLNIRPNNTAPVAQALSASVSPGQVVVLNLIGSDADQDPLTFRLKTEPLSGQATLEGNQLSYQASANASGQITFTYVAFDGLIESEPAVITITMIENDLPVAEDQSYSLLEDQSANLVLSGNDPESSPITYEVVNQVRFGQLNGVAPNLIYIPAANFNGVDSFTYRVNDGARNSELATVTLNVLAVDDLAIAENLEVTTLEDQSINFPLAATDADGDPITFQISTLPERGQLNLNNDRVTYSPESNDFGEVSFTYVAISQNLESEAATVTISITAVNDAPSSSPVTVETALNEPVDIVLQGADIDGDDLTYTLISQPSHGTLEGLAPNLSYRPQNGFVGEDQFSYQVNDGQANSSISSVSITVNESNEPNEPLSISSIEVSTPEDQVLNLLLSCTSALTGEITYELVSQPQLGSLEGSGANRQYRPNLNQSGVELFSYRCRQNELVSENAEIQITIQAVNDAPVVVSQNLNAVGGTPLAFSIEVNDPDPQDQITSEITMQAQHGQIAGSFPNYVYIADLGYNGLDEIIVVANDGQVNSAPAAITFVVSSVNHAPSAQNLFILTNEDEEVDIELSASDLDNDDLSYELISQPQLGRLIGNNGSYTYIPDANAFGEDQFSYQVFDGQERSNEAVVTIEIQALNDSPELRNTQYIMLSDESITVTLEGSDVENDALSYLVEALPSNGTIALEANQLTYTPTAGFVGMDIIQMIVSDGDLFSEPASLSFLVQTNPNTVDSDGDGISDVDEEALGLDPNSADSDGDGQSDREELGNMDEPRDVDEDGIIDALDVDLDNDGIDDDQDDCPNSEAQAMVDEQGCEVEEMQAGEMQAGEMQAGETQAGEMQAGETQAGEMQAGEMQAGEESMNVPTPAEGCEAKARPTTWWMLLIMLVAIFGLRSLSAEQKE